MPRVTIASLGTELDIGEGALAGRQRGHVDLRAVQLVSRAMSAKTLS